MKKILKNLLVAIGIIIYFMILNFAYIRMNTERLSNDIKVFAGTYLVLGLFALEKAYKEDSGKLAITAIELLVLSFHSLSIMHMVNVFKCDFNFYLIISSAIAASYYLVKGVVIYTKDRREYLKGLSDISEIVKEHEPIKKEAKKRNVRKDETKEKVEDNQKENTETKKEVNPQKNTETKKSTVTKKTSTTASKKTQTKKATSANKTTQTKKTRKPEEKSEVKTQTEKKTTKKTIKNDEIKTEVKPKTQKKRTSIKKKEVESTIETPKEKKTRTTSTTTKKTSIKSKKEVKEND